MSLKGFKSGFLSTGLIGAVATILAGAASLAGFPDVHGKDISSLIAGGVAIVGGAGLYYKRFTQKLKGLDWQSAVLAGVTTATGLYVTLTGDNEGASVMATNINSIIMTAGALLSAFGIGAAKEKIGTSKDG